MVTLARYETVTTYLCRRVSERRSGLLTVKDERAFCRSTALRNLGSTCLGSGRLWFAVIVIGGWRLRELRNHFYSLFNQLINYSRLLTANISGRLSNIISLILS